MTTSVESAVYSVRPYGSRLPRRRSGAVRFSRAPLGRRGISEDEVSQFCVRVAEEVSRLEAENATLRTENDRLKTALRQWQSEQASKRADNWQSRRPDGPSAYGQAQTSRRAAPTTAAAAQVQREAEAILRRAAATRTPMVTAGPTTRCCRRRSGGPIRRRSGWPGPTGPRRCPVRGRVRSWSGAWPGRRRSWTRRRWRPGCAPPGRRWRTRSSAWPSSGGTPPARRQPGGSPGGVVTRPGSARGAGPAAWWPCPGVPEVGRHLLAPRTRVVRGRSPGRASSPGRPCRPAAAAPWSAPG